MTLAAASLHSLAGDRHFGALLNETIGGFERNTLLGDNHLRLA
jgi:hypothetical protein